MDYTPRQIEALLFIARRRRNAELAELLALQALAASGDRDKIRAQVEKLTR